MRDDKTDNSIDLISESFLCEKIEKIRLTSKGYRKHPLSLFKQHTNEVIQKVLSRLEDAKSSDEASLKRQYYLFSWFCLWQLNNQFEAFKLVEASVNDSRWKTINFVILNLLRRLEISTRPLPFFGSSFYCTGSFMYRRYRAELSPFYQVSLDLNDSVLFWPLVAHEIAHLKLSEASYTHELEVELFRNGLLDEKYRERLRECVCDALATRIYGPAYIASFITKFWQVFDRRPDESYPRPHFRFLIMLKSLENEDLDYTLDLLNEYFRLNDADAEEEDLFFLSHKIIDLSKEMLPEPIAINDDQIVNLANNFKKIPGASLDYLFNASWFAILHGLKRYDEVSEITSETLERWASRSNSSAKF